MKFRILDNLTNIKEYNGVSLSANLQCSCGGTEFQFWHTGKQTKGILSPFIVRNKHPLVLKAVCPNCHHSIIVYDSGTDGADAHIEDCVKKFELFDSNKVSKQFPVVIKYNYLPEKFKTGERYSNEFENCFIYIIDKNGKEEKALIEE